MVSFEMACRSQQKSNEKLFDHDRLGRTPDLTPEDTKHDSFIKLKSDFSSHTMSHAVLSVYVGELTPSKRQSILSPIQLRNISELDLSNPLQNMIELHQVGMGNKALISDVVRLQALYQYDGMYFEVDFVINLKDKSVAGYQSIFDKRCNFHYTIS